MVEAHIHKSPGYMMVGGVPYADALGAIKGEGLVPANLHNLMDLTVHPKNTLTAEQLEFLALGRISTTDLLGVNHGTMKIVRDGASNLDIGALTLEYTPSGGAVVTDAAYAAAQGINIDTDTGTFYRFFGRNDETVNPVWTTLVPDQKLLQEFYRRASESANGRPLLTGDSWSHYLPDPYTKNPALYLVELAGLSMGTQIVVSGFNHPVKMLGITLAEKASVKPMDLEARAS